MKIKNVLFLAIVLLLGGSAELSFGKGYGASGVETPGSFTCGAGTYPGIAQTSCPQCPAGTYSLGGTKNPSWGCPTCPVGAHPEYCTKCPAGTSSNIVGATSSTSCTPCPAGQTSSVGATSCRALTTLEKNTAACNACLAKCSISDTKCNDACNKLPGCQG